MQLRTRSAFVLWLALATASPVSAQLVDAASHANALIHYRLGEELRRNEQFGGAVTEFQAAIKFDPLLSIAHYELGQTFMAMRRYADAVGAYLACRSVYEQVSAIVAKNSLVLDQRRDDELRVMKEELSEIQSGQVTVGPGRDLLIVRLEHQISERERMKLRDRTTVDTPAELSLALGSAYFRSGDLQAAEREWKTAVATNARLGEAHNNLAALYAMTGRKQNALDAVKQAEKSGYRVNPRLKSDIQAMPKESASR